jgi:hypothetical protein
MVEVALSYDQQAIPKGFNNHFSSIASTVNNKNAYNKTRTNEMFATFYNYLLQNCLNPLSINGC